MKSDTIKILLEKYYEGESSLEEEKELRAYFSSSDVDPELEHLRDLFGYYTKAKQQKLSPKLVIVKKHPKIRGWAIAATISLMIALGAYWYRNLEIVAKHSELGSYEDPKQALQATQEALALLSENVNQGIQGVQYLKEYERTKDKIFIE